jgi:hypothetical protein
MSILDNDWLASVKVGDVVFTDSRWGGLRRMRVTKMTATQIVCGGERFKRTNGRRIGDSGYDVLYLLEFTPAKESAYQFQQAVNYLKVVTWAALPAAVVIEIAARVRSIPENAKK